MNRKLYFLFFLVLLFSINYISAAPPFQTNTNGLEIAGVDFSAIKTVTNRTAVANVYNSTNGLPIVSGVTCQFQVFRVGDTGSLIFTNSTPKQINNTFYFGIPNTIYQESVEYTRIIQCNSTTEGGFYKSTFVANQIGQEGTISTAFFYIGLLLILVIFFVMILVYGLNTENIVGQTFSIGFGYLFLIGIFFIAWQMANLFIFAPSFIIDFFKIGFTVLIIGFIPLLFILFAYGSYMMLQIKEIKDMQERGISIDEINERKFGAAGRY